MVIVGIVGQIGSGKTEIGNILMRDKQFKQESFAKPLKDLCSVVFKWDRNLLEGATKESREWREQVDDNWSNRLKKKITPRYILQTIGSEVMRDNFYEDIWIESLKNRLDSANENIVITDVRFCNEIKAIKDIGGIIIKVERDVLTGGGNKLHISETDWNNSDIEFDYIIKNNGSLDDLKKNIIELF